MARKRYYLANLPRKNYGFTNHLSKRTNRSGTAECGILQPFFKRVLFKKADFQERQFLLMTPKQRYSINVILLVIWGVFSFSVSARTQSLSLPELDSKHVQWAHLSFHAKNFWVEV